VANPSTVIVSDAGQNGRAFVLSLAARLTAAGAVIGPTTEGTAADPALTPSLVAGALAGTPTLVAFGGDVRSGLALAAAARAAQPRSVFLNGGQSGVAGCADSLSELGEGDLCAVGATPLSSSVRARAFREDYAAAGYGAPTVSVTAAYDAAMLVIRSLRPAITTLGEDPDPDALRAPLMDVLRTARLDGATGTSTFDVDGDRTVDAMSVLRKQGGRWVAVAATG
jgi:ABC-type branched-subunit amino acid transport system substrate-binding protein